MNITSMTESDIPSESKETTIETNRAGAQLVPPADALVDGRQSETALGVRKGTQRLLIEHGFMAVPEVSLVSGRRADLVALDGKGAIWIIEVKSSLADLRADHKWPNYRRHCDRLYFATAPHVDRSAFPEDAGLIIADPYGAEIVREAPVHPLAGAARKSTLIRTARQAASRLMRADGLQTNMW